MPNLRRNGGRATHRSGRGGLLKWAVCRETKRRRNDVSPAERSKQEEGREANVRDVALVSLEIHGAHEFGSSLPMPARSTSSRLEGSLELLGASLVSFFESSRLLASRCFLSQWRARSHMSMRKSCMPWPDLAETMSMRLLAFGMCWMSF